MSSSPMNALEESEEGMTTAAAYPWTPNGGAALLALTLLEKYHQVAQVFKVLRKERDIRKHFDQGDLLKGHGEMSAEDIEAHRAVATGLFNQLFILVQNRLIDPAMLAVVLQPRAASLWLELVAPLDAEVRTAAAARAGMTALTFGEHPIEIFYRKYADTGQVLLLQRRPKDVEPSGRPS